MSVSRYRTGLKTLRFLTMVLLCVISSQAYCAVNITAATNGAGICNTKAVGGTAAGYTTLGVITIAETSTGDLSGPGTDLLVLNAPAGWQFNTITAPSMSYLAGGNIIATPVFTITATTLSINVSTNGTGALDQFSIAGLQVQATSAGAATGNIYPSAALNIAGLTTGAGGTNFGTLSVVAPAAPTVSIAASPATAVCPGTNVIFTPTPTNGGAVPVYQWYLNGASIATGATYANTNLTNGNTVYCLMTSNGSCLTTTSATSNTIAMTVFTGPLPVNGPSATCPGTTISLSDVSTGGTWSSNNGSVAGVDGSGNVTGTGVGTALISYTTGSCAAVATITVNQPPAAPSLTTTTTTMCSGDVFAITANGTPSPAVILTQNFNAGLGTWTVDNTGSVGTVAASAWKACGNGYVNEQGTYHSPDNSGFVMSNSDTSGSASYTSSKLISPTFSLAGYAGATLTFQQAYEYWPAGDTAVSVQITTNGGATWTTLQNFVGSNVGGPTGFISETFSLNGYLGQPNVQLRFYYYCHWGYFWAIDNIQVTGISSIVTPVWSPSTNLFNDLAYSTPYTGAALSTVYVHPPSITTAATITYTATAVSAVCASSSSSVVNFTPSPAPISGGTNLCASSVTNLSDITAGGAWSSSNTAAATVGASTGVVSGVAAGTATISYRLGTGCTVTTVVTVNVVPANISGSTGVCMGGGTTLSDPTTGGRWVSSNTATATIGSATGVLSSVATGTTNITYTLGPGCISTAVVTVNPLPGIINGTPTVCMGAVTNLTDGTGGGTWSSGTAAIASVPTGAGNVSGITAGSAAITYTLGTGCYMVQQVTVNPLYAILGTTNVCAGLTVSLSDTTAGGTWSTNNASIATTGTATGNIYGAGAGSTTVSYILPTGCVATTNITVNPLPATITAAAGAAEVCAGLSTGLTDAVTGGTWSSSNAGTAGVGSSNGVVTGVVNGTALITYTLGTGCLITTTVTVDPLPQPIQGNATVCAGLSTTLSDLTNGGTWSSGSTDIATIDGSSGIVTGVANGTAVITYTLPTGCIMTDIVTVNALPPAINGSTQVCTGLTISLTDNVTGGTWTSTNTAAVTIGSSTGVATGAGSGTATITYTLGTGCVITTTVTDNPLPLVINGPGAVCAGLSIALTDATGGGTWTSGSVGTATVVAGTGVVTGIAAGSVKITYTLPTGCIMTRTITVNPLPGAINGTTVVCQGLTTTLTDATLAGTWSSSTPGTGTAGSTSGIVAGISAGTTTITYTIGTGCIMTTVVTVSALPPAISGSKSLCQGTNTTLTDGVAGGTWLSGNTLSVLIGSGSGLVTGFGNGTSVVTYTIPAGAGVGCSITTIVTVNPNPVGISGAGSLCSTGSITLSDGTGGGSWSSSNTGTATISSAGAVSGVSGGAVTIFYILPTSCSTSKTVVVGQTPAAITGNPAICNGASNTLSDAYGGGTWTSSNTAVATIGSLSGVASGIGLGTSNITYTLSGGCNIATTVTVNAAPGSINGAGALCAGATTTLTDATAAGTWSNDNTTIATTGTVGLVTGLAAGTTNITYLLADGCAATKQLTINVTPGPINGVGSVCVGMVTSLTDTVTGGTWSSSAPGIAGVGTAVGNVGGLSAGSALITYGFATGCQVTMPVTVNVTPAAISGNTNVCLGFTTPLSDGTGGGTWSSANTDVATTGSTGLVSTLMAGTATISYTLADGCAVTKTMIVNTQPSVIGGTTTICAGTVTGLTDSISGGNWSSSNTAVATIDATGLLTGAGAGSATITYSLSAGCIATTGVTVNVLPSSIAGVMSVCAGLTTTLSDPYNGGGTWSSSTPATATVNGSTGVVTGINVGTTTITYSLGIGCTLATIVTVNPLPSAITASANLCYGSLVSMSDGTMGGTWSSGNTFVAGIGASSGTVAGLSTGTTTITYTLGTGCIASTTITVYPLPAVISGVQAVCKGLSVTLTDSTPGGTWSSNNVATVTAGSATGSMYGAVAGTATISYTLNTGCATTTIVTVNPLPPAISGNNYVCQGLTDTLTDAASGGVWSSPYISVNITGSSGIVTGISTGASIITYTLPTGCINVMVFTVNPLPAAINGSTNVCAGLSINLSDNTTGGTWSGTGAIANVGSGTGTVTGITAGSANITYTISTGCKTMQNITVNALPTAIYGPAKVCYNSNITLSDTTVGGGWGSSNTAVATVNASTGNLYGAAVGSATITYTTAQGCITTYPVTVNPLPALISGTKSVCPGSTTNLTDSLSGGVWSSGATGTATVGTASGIVTGGSAGIVTINYLSGNGCSIATTVTVNPLPVAISGGNSVCVSGIAVLTDGSGGGTWSSSNGAIALSTGAGNIHGIAAGSATITYTLPTSCYITQGITVNPLPSIITGNRQVCQGLTTALSDTLNGGTWSSGNISAVTVGTASGLVSGGGAGTSVITYTLPTSCSITAIVTVNPLPAAITGNLTFCVGLTSTLSDGTGGGIWSSADATVSVGSASGIVTGISAGTAVITYMLGTGCINTTTVTVNPLATISGNTFICQGNSSALSDATGTGAWTSSNTGVAIIDAYTGIVSGVGTGTATITFVLSAGCVTSTVVTVNALPAGITGTTNVCAGLATLLSDTTPAGNWSSNDTTIASIDIAGNVTGISAGNTTITYTVGGTGCVAVAAITVNPLPGMINGVTELCKGSTTNLTDSTAGGVWSTDNIAVTAISDGGMVAGVAAGTADITYTLGTGCIQSMTVTIDPLPSMIAGSKNICAGFTTSLSDTVTGGLWSSGEAPGIVTVAAAVGVISGAAVGTAVITYTLYTGCIATTIVTVNPLPLPVTGNVPVCAGLTITLSDAGGGTWTSNNTSVAAVGTSTGVVTGAGQGVTVITYTLPTGCVTFVTVTVNPLPGNITGANSVCVGSTIGLGSTTSGGVWSVTGLPGVANIDAVTGVVSGLSAGTAAVTYMLGTGCIATTAITVNPLPAIVTGTTNVCVGLTTALTDGTSGGAWSTTDATAGVGSSSGIVTGISAGAATITYKLNTGCIAISRVTVNPLPATISGTQTVCVGLNTTLSDATTGGTWTSGAAATGSIGTSSGVVTGMVSGTAAVTYTLGTGCITTTTITVNPLPAGITGTNSVCAGLVVNLTDITAAGSWTSGATGICTVNATGAVTGISAGTALITYRLPTSCLVTTVETVNPLPSSILGSNTVCTGTTITLTDLTTGGTWSITGAAAGIGGSTGVVTGIATGSAAITYMLSTGCITTATETVFSSPLNITGSNAVCAGATISLSDATPAGTWSSSNTTVAGVGSITGLVTGYVAGTTTITYSLGTGCFSVSVITVNPLPAPISGTLVICTGYTSLLTDAVAGGVWSRDAGAAGIATIGPTTGIVSATSAGLATVTYTLSTGCYVTGIVTVNSSPAGIAGVTHVCAGLSSTLSDASTGGTWSSNNTTTATVTAGTGVVTGGIAGTAVISYILPTGCYVAAVFTVNPLPSVIAGNKSVCLASTNHLSDTAAGGIWSISGGGIAAIGSTTGNVTGNSLGTAMVTYTLPTGCLINTLVTVNPYPVAITGAGIVCQGSGITLSDATSGGAWSSSNTAVATVASGGVTGMGGGSVSISYTLPTGCYVTKTVMVNPIFPVGGVSRLCAGTVYTFSDLAIGGTWSSTNSTVASIASATGVATAVASGTTIISYMLSTGCNARLVLSVDPIPASFNVGGGGYYCAGGTGAVITLNGSDTNIVYRVYDDTTFMSSLPGTAAALHFGPYTATGTYHIIAVNATTGCSNDMLGTDTIGINPVVTPSVTITTGMSDTVCEGMNTIFTALPVYGGPSPVYSWYVNTLPVTGASGSIYSYIPATGDVVSVVLTSDAVCTSTTTAFNSLTVVSIPNVLPAVSLSVVPGDTLCAHIAATIMPAPLNGGTAPTYHWMKNGADAGWGSTYSYMPTNGDNIFCVLHSNYRCVLTDSAFSSNNISMVVKPYPSTTALIATHPGNSIMTGQSDTLIAEVTNPGLTIAYQWKINGIAVTGAVHDTFIYAAFDNNDTVSCTVTSGNACGDTYVNATTIINVSSTGIQQINTGGMEVVILPNPNNGDLTIKGTTGTNVDGELQAEITNMLGEVVYKSSIIIRNGKIYKALQLGPDIANGMYLLRLFSPVIPVFEQKVYNFVISK